MRVHTRHMPIYTRTTVSYMVVFCPYCEAQMMSIGLLKTSISKHRSIMRSFTKYEEHQRQQRCKRVNKWKRPTAKRYDNTNLANEKYNKDPVHTLSFWNSFFANCPFACTWLNFGYEFISSLILKKPELWFGISFPNGSILV